MRECRVTFIIVVCFLAGCGTETVAIRSIPPGATVSIGSKTLGTAPLNYETSNVQPFICHVEKENYPAVDAPVYTKIAKGRVVGAIFTAGILALFKPMSVFVPNPVEVNLNPMEPSPPHAAALRLYDVKGATVLEGSCTRADNACWIDVGENERCKGEFIAEKQGVTATATSSHTGSQGALGTVGGHLGAALLGFQSSGEAVASETASMNKAVIVLRCEGNVIDCSLMVETSAMRGHGDCTDSKGRNYRLTLLP